MKKAVSLASAVSVALACVPGVASANEGFYLGLKSGVMDIDVKGYDTNTPVGVLAGYTFANNFAIEAEYNKVDINFSALGVKADGDFSTMAIYGAYRSEGDLYGKLKVGYLSDDVSLTASGITAKAEDDGFSAGVGAGYRFGGNFSVEAEYTVIEKDVNYFSLGLNYYF